MKERLKYIILITSISFTLVVLINCLFIISGLSSTILDPIDIIAVFLTSLMISVFIAIGDMVPLLKNYPLIYNYLVCITFAMGANYLVYRHFYWVNFSIQILVVTFIFTCVYLCVYAFNYKGAQTINKKIKEKYNRNQK